jgi:hypothetical protein
VRNKFKRGDRVVIVVDSAREGLLGVTGTVLEDDIMPFIQLDDETRYPRRNGNPLRWAVLEDYMELESVYNSPLYQALL